MDLIIRLKRPRKSDPFDALVLASKRRKKDSDASTSAENDCVPTILKFAGNLKNQEEDISPHIFKARQRVDLKSLDRLKAKDVMKNVRSEAKRTSKENRFKVINFSRKASNILLDHNYAESESESKDLKGTPYTIVDIVHDQQTSELSEPLTEDDGYIYSLYYADSAGGAVNDEFMESVISIEAIDVKDFALYDYRGQDGEDVIPDDEDDSNDENNWRNDYPDSDYDKEKENGDHSDESVEYMMEHLTLDGSERDLSSDDGEENLPYGVDADEINQLGREYAHFKARVTKELDDYGSEVESSSEDDE